MTFRDCVNRAVAAGRANKKRAEEALERYDELRENYRSQGMDDAEAERLASGAATETLERDAIRKKIVAARNAEVTGRILRDFRLHKNYKGENDWNQAATDLWEGGATNYIARRNTLNGYGHGIFYTALNKYAPKMAGLRRPTDGLDNLLREVWGQKTGDDAASEMAAAWKETADFYYSRAVAAGADIGKREDWHLPSMHDAARIMRDTPEDYAKFTSDLLDWAAMEKQAQGELFTLDRRAAVLREVRDTLVQDGAGKIKPSLQARSSSLASRMGASRFLIFKDAESQLQYHNRYGMGSIFDVMTSHIENMAHEIAMLEVFGPNPAATKEWVKSVLVQHAAEGSKGASNTKAITAARSAGVTFDRIYGAVTGSNNALRDTVTAQVLAGTRNLLTGALLGSASISAVTGDLFTKAHWRVMSRLPMAKTAARYTDALLKESTREQMVRAGFLFDSAVHNNASMVRWFGTVTGPEVTRRVTDTVMRASLMNRHTEGIRWTMMSEFSGMLNDYKGSGFEALDPGLQAMFRKYNITPAMWDRLRSIDATEYGPVKMLVPNNLRSMADTPQAKIDNAIADAFMGMIFTERDNAIASTSLKATATLRGEVKNGTFIGEVINSVAMFKNFPVTIMQLHLRRMLEMPGVGGRIAYGTTFVTGMTIMGAMAYQLRQAAQGKDPVPRFGEKGWAFWGQSFLQGGGLGILGDFLFKDTNRFGGGLTQTLTGPVVGFGADTIKLTIGNAMEVVQDKDTNIARELINYTRRYTPGAGLWWARLGLQRGLFDQLLIQADPQAYQKFGQQQQAAMRDYGQEYWWPPGETAPQRGPDLGNALRQ